MEPEFLFCIVGTMDFSPTTLLSTIYDKNGNKLIYNIKNSIHIFISKLDKGSSFPSAF